ncbi:flagellar hook-length control protein FliK [Pacificibacter maritimus]|uniref:Flagellar hook-length control protein FliK n=2 Tax=Pacificibacter maritimus TaxID=762213 RepID=A0A3N4UBV9_9RHOB|nr:flagellar hook-length control protein FliK [Pacificibacter maritimus]
MQFMILNQPQVNLGQTQALELPIATDTIALADGVSFESVVALEASDGVTAEGDYTTISMKDLSISGVNQANPLPQLGTPESTEKAEFSHIPMAHPKGIPDHNKNNVVDDLEEQDAVVFAETTTIEVDPAQTIPVQQNAEPAYFYGSHHVETHSDEKAVTDDLAPEAESFAQESTVEILDVTPKENPLGADLRATQLEQKTNQTEISATSVTPVSGRNLDASFAIEKTDIAMPASTKINLHTDITAAVPNGDQTILDQASGGPHIAMPHANVGEAAAASSEFEPQKKAEQPLAPIVPKSPDSEVPQPPRHVPIKTIQTDAGKNIPAILNTAERPQSVSNTPEQPQANVASPPSSQSPQTPEKHGLILTSDQEAKVRDGVHHELQETPIESPEIELQPEPTQTSEPTQHVTKDTPQMTVTQAPLQDSFVEITQSNTELEVTPSFAAYDLMAERADLPQTALPLALATQPELPARLAAQIADVAKQLPDGPIEISLSPEELGKVKLTFQLSESGAMTVVIAAERPDTLEFMRRNADSLLAEFSELGYENSSLQFQQDNQNNAQDGSDKHAHKSADGGDLNIASQTHPLDQTKKQTPTLNLTASSGMDLRL